MYINTKQPYIYFVYNVFELCAYCINIMIDTYNMYVIIHYLIIVYLLIISKKTA